MPVYSGSEQVQPFWSDGGGQDAPRYLRPPRCPSPSRRLRSRSRFAGVRGERAGMPGAARGARRRSAWSRRLGGVQSAFASVTVAPRSPRLRAPLASRHSGPLRPIFDTSPSARTGRIRGLVVRAARRRFARRAPLRRSPPCGRLRRAASAPFMLLPRGGSVGASGTALAHGPAGGGAPRPHRAGRRPAAAPPLALRRSPHGARPARADRAPPPSSP